MSFEHFCFRAVQVTLHTIWFASPIYAAMAFGHGIQEGSKDSSWVVFWCGMFAFIVQLTIVGAYLS